MRVTRGIFLVLVGISCIPFGFAQRPKKGKPIEVGLMLGASTYMGDLSKTVNFKRIHPAGGIICRFNYSEFLTLRGSAWFGQLSGYDSDYSDDTFRTRRNLSFKSNVFEFSGQFEYNILGFGETTSSNPFSPYLFGGVGVFKYNPKTLFKYINDPLVHDASLRQYDGKWIELQPLGTEGQETTKFNERKRYPLTQVSIPLGFGFKKQFADEWAYGFEFGIRKTFTDYIDDVSKTYVNDQIISGAYGFLASALKDRAAEVNRPRFDDNLKRGTSTSSDWYMFAGFTITRKITGGKQRCFAF